MANFLITILKGQSGYKWVNSYQVEADNLGGAAAVTTALVAAEKAMHSDSVNFLQAKTAADPDPSGQDFVTAVLTGNGARNITGSARIGPSVVLLGLFGAQQGRPGKKFYRYVLSETDIFANGEGHIFESPANEAIYTTFLANVLAAINNAGGTLTVGATHKPVSGAVSARIATLPTRHGWFNRKPSTGPTEGAGL